MIKYLRGKNGREQNTQDATYDYNKGRSYNKYHIKDDTKATDNKSKRNDKRNDKENPKPKLSLTPNSKLIPVTDKRNPEKYYFTLFLRFKIMGINYFMVIRLTIL